MLLEPRFKRRGRGAIYNNRRKGVPEGIMTINKDDFCCKFTAIHGIFRRESGRIICSPDPSLRAEAGWLARLP